VEDPAGLMEPCDCLILTKP